MMKVVQSQSHEVGTYNINKNYLSWFGYDIFYMIELFICHVDMLFNGGVGLWVGSS